MKKIKISLATIAFALGIAGAFAFKPAEVSLDTAYYYVDGSGNPTDPVPPSGADCELSTNICAEEFNLVDGMPTTSTGNKVDGDRIQ